MREEIMGFLMVLAGTIMLIILGIIYFAVTLLIIKVAVEFIFEPGALDANWGALAAALLTMASMLGGSMTKGSKIFMKQ
ncbi:MAG TPA: hypothetical protein VMW85_08330 [Methanomassiliicoccales archaeon]|nr:hypothetical protein [Methanomassiliicoccales archaeon]